MQTRPISWRAARNRRLQQRLEALGAAWNWLFNPFDRAIEVYLLRDGDYLLQQGSVPLHPQAFPGVEIDP